MAPKLAGQLVEDYAPYAAAEALAPFWAARCADEASAHWELFYRRNADRAFKDRHYLDREWTELASNGAAGADGGGAPLVLLEAGCGVGNALFPLLESNPRLRAYAVDVSESAVQMVRSHALASEGRIVAAAAGDLTSGELPLEIAGCEADLATLIFVLSAIAPAKMVCALRAVAKGLKRGGVCLLRDYASGDGAQKRYMEAAGAKRLYPELPCFVRADGTLAYYFTEDELCSLFDQAGFDKVSCVHTHGETANRKTGLSMERHFWTARFRRR